jgi:hypothetical protein
LPVEPVEPVPFDWDALFNVAMSPRRSSAFAEATADKGDRRSFSAFGDGLEETLASNAFFGDGFGIGFGVVFGFGVGVGPKAFGVDVGFGVGDGNSISLFAATTGLCSCTSSSFDSFASSGGVARFADGDGSLSGS